MTDLYRRLQGVGLTKSFVKQRILPEWWDDEIAENDAGFAEALAYLARFTGLDIRSLRNRTVTPSFRPLPVCKFKKTKSTSESELSLARAVATRAAQLVSPAVQLPSQSLPASAAQVRAEILGQGETWVSLRNLLDYCWNVGVPVVHIAQLPTGKRPHGLCAVIEGKPVIVICKNDNYTAWLLFILAHELGHVLLGHVEDNEVLLDEDTRNLGDQEEQEADRFAIELLTGDAERRYYATGSWPNAEQLAMMAEELGHRDQVDPGHIVLNYAHSMQDFWPVARAALEILEPDDGAIGQILEKMAEHLDWSTLSRENAEYLVRITQAETGSWTS